MQGKIEKNRIRIYMEFVIYSLSRYAIQLRFKYCSVVAMNHVAMSGIPLSGIPFSELGLTFVSVLLV